MWEARRRKKVLALAVSLFIFLPLTGAHDTGGVGTIVPIDYRCSSVGGMPAVSITYKNPNYYNLTVIVYAVVRNSLGQTVNYETESVTLPGNGTATVYLLTANQPQGSYLTIAFALLSNGLAISPQVSVQCPETILGPQTFTQVAPPTQPWTCLCAQIAYMNNANSTVTGIVYAMFHNSLGQTVFISTATITPAAGHLVTALLAANGLANASYLVTLFAVTPNGVTLSTVSLLYASN